MNRSIIKEEMKQLCQSKNWRRLMGLIEDGYKGMFVILRIVRDSSDPVVAGDLAKQMNVSTARIARALNTLEEKHYIERANEKDDARKVVIRITGLGSTALAEREKEVDNMVAPMLANLTDDEMTQFFSLLKKLLQ